MLWRERLKNEVRATLELHGIYDDELAEDIATSIPSPDERNGYAIVPVEPTPEMVAAGGKALNGYIEAMTPEERESRRGHRGAEVTWREKMRERYKAMVAAAITSSTAV